MLELLKKLCALNGVSGCEDDVRSFIRTYCEPLADEIDEDKTGNLIVFKKGIKPSQKRVLIAAHMDEVGLIVKSIDDDGYLKFSFVGGVDRRVMLGSRVLIGENKLPGIIALKAHHLVSKEEEKRVPKVSEMYIDIGMANREEAESAVSIGDYGAFISDTVEFGDGYMKAKALDDRIGCALMLRLIEETPPIDTYFAFTVGEEVGTRGAFGAAFSIKPDICLVLEGTTAADIPSLESGKRVCALRKGPVVPFMDNATVYDRELFELIKQCAEELELPWQTKEFLSGGTDASAIQRSRTGVKVAAISAPLRYIHSPSSVGCKSDFEDMYRLAKRFLEKIGDGV